MSGKQLSTLPARKMSLNDECREINTASFYIALLPDLPFGCLKQVCWLWLSNV